MKSAFIALAIQLTIVAQGQIPNNKGVKQGVDGSIATEFAKLPKQVRELIELARAAPPEVASDVLLRVATSKHVSSKRIKLMLMEDAFERATFAQQPINKRSLSSSPIDSRSGYQSRGFRLNRDTVTLQSLAVSAMLTYEPRKAVAHFSRIQLPVRPLDCSDALVFDVSQYYTTASSLLLNGFSEREQRKGDQIAFAESLLTRVTSPAQVNPAAKLLMAVSDSWELVAVSRLANLFASALDASVVDSRSFGAATNRSSVGDMGGLLIKLQQKQIPVRTLFEAYERYLLKNAKSVKCADGTYLNSRSDKPPDYFSYVIDILTPQLFPAGDVTPIDVKSINPRVIESAAPIVLYWKSPTTAAILTSLKRLRFGSANTPLSDAERAGVEWQTQFRAVLERIRDWKRGEEEEGDFYAQKSQSLLALASLAPKSLYPAVISELFSTIRASRLPSTSVAEWLVFLRELVSEASIHRVDSLANVWEQMKLTGDPTMQVYSDLNNLGLYN